ncbi:PREDICTED: CD209 antigen-like [Pterocles gutturalis]|uniref:CD209 antigen-like n=1 Tax=Pterocles gutturalis TaxID=240206 RepID=UPI00052888B7|nr:PREDICTED: CD209 antigen-like [Pterocles gutturalis]
MSQGNSYENLDRTEGMEMEKQERRKMPKGVLSLLTWSLERPVTLLYVLLALTFVLFTALTIVNAQRDKQLSGELEAIHSRLLNVSQEVENMRWKMTQCKAECGKELSDRLRVLEILCTRCPAGWLQFAKTCYFFSTTTKPWLEAKDFCTNFNAHLAIIDSEQENKFLANNIMETRVFWLGLTDVHKESEWQWVDGRSLSLSFWNPGEPNNVGEHGEDCATIYTTGRWNDVPKRDACFAKTLRCRIHRPAWRQRLRWKIWDFIGVVFNTRGTETSRLNHWPKWGAGGGEGCAEEHAEGFSSPLGACAAVTFPGKAMAQQETYGNWLGPPPVHSKRLVRQAGIYSVAGRMTPMGDFRPASPDSFDDDYDDVSMSESDRGCKPPATDGDLQSQRSKGGTGVYILAGKPASPNPSQKGESPGITAAIPRRWPRPDLDAGIGDFSPISPHLLHR